jgi:hypothetical protein
VLRFPLSGAFNPHLLVRDVFFARRDGVIRSFGGTLAKQAIQSLKPLREFRPSLVVVGRATCPSRSGLRQPSYSCPTPSCTVADILDLAEWPAEQLRLVVERWQPVAEVRIERIR